MGPRPPPAPDETQKHEVPTGSADGDFEERLLEALVGVILADDDHDGASTRMVLSTHIVQAITGEGWAPTPALGLLAGERAGTTDLCVDATVRAALGLGFQVAAVVADAHTVSDRPHLNADRIIEHHHWV